MRVIALSLTIGLPVRHPPPLDHTVRGSQQVQVARTESHAANRAIKVKRPLELAVRSGQDAHARFSLDEDRRKRALGIKVGLAEGITGDLGQPLTGPGIE